MELQEEKIALKIRSEEFFQGANSLIVSDEKELDVAKALLEEGENSIKILKSYADKAMNKPMLYFMNGLNMVHKKVGGFTDSVRLKKEAEEARKNEIEANTKRIQEHQKYLKERSSSQTPEHVFHEKKNEIRKDSFEIPNQAHVSHAEVKKKLGRPKGVKGVNKVEVK